jgi:hypothetical protein
MAAKKKPEKPANIIEVGSMEQAAIQQASPHANQTLMVNSKNKGDVEEQDGIIGEGMSFSRDEKEIAVSKASELKPPFNVINIQTMINSSIQQASDDADQSSEH